MIECGQTHSISEWKCRLPANHRGPHLHYAPDRARCGECGQPTPERQHAVNVLATEESAPACWCGVKHYPRPALRLEPTLDVERLVELLGEAARDCDNTAKHDECFGGQRDDVRYSAEQLRALAAALPDLLRAASERDDLTAKYEQLEDRYAEAVADLIASRARVQQFTDELAEANMLFSLSSLRQQAEALPRYETEVKDGIPSEFSEMVESPEGEYLKRDAVLQLLTPQTPET